MCLSASELCGITRNRFVGCGSRPLASVFASRPESSLTVDLPSLPKSPPSSNKPFLSAFSSWSMHDDRLSFAFSITPEYPLVLKSSSFPASLTELARASANNKAWCANTMTDIMSLYPGAAPNPRGAPDLACCPQISSRAFALCRSDGGGSRADSGATGVTPVHALDFHCIETGGLSADGLLVDGNSLWLFVSTSFRAWLPESIESEPGTLLLLPTRTISRIRSGLKISSTPECMTLQPSGLTSCLTSR
mmetsp:Transcript_52527/g.107111  ORF Transcript_52527/g.107111 Transcript_52527/m.107111 type:complete len:249 (-) Transcript_52527:56-802(-)